ncbi:hypothetical protein ACHWQZ_G004604 [Mnemiopsis leidyi]
MFKTTQNFTFLAGYVVYLMITDFISYGSYNKISTVSTSSIILPSVTICSMNPMNYSSLVEDLGEDSDVVKELKELMWDAQLANDYNFRLSSDNYSNLIEYEEENGPLSFIYRNDAASLIALTSRHDYYLGKIGENIRNWLTETGSNELGSCIELNDDSSLSQNISGSRYGLTLDLDASLLTYAPFTSSVGLKVFIKDHDETVFFNEGGIVVQPGTETFMKVSLSKIVRLGPNWGTCQNVTSSVSKYDSTIESRRECLEVAKVREMLDKVEYCGCIPWFVVIRLREIGRVEILDQLLAPVTNSSSNSRKKRDSWDQANENYTEIWGDDIAEEMEKYDDFDDFFIKGLNYSEYFCDSYSQAKCDNRFPSHWASVQEKYSTICHDPCASNHYDVVVSSTKFPPTENYFNDHLKDYEGLEYTWEYAKENLIRLHVYYDKMEYLSVVQTKDYEIQNFIGELGGVVDLFIGFSFFTVFQLIEIVIAAVILRKCRRKTASDSENDERNGDV